MPRLTADFGRIDGCEIRVLDTGDEFPSVRYMAWVPGMAVGQSWGPNSEIAVRRLKDRARDGRTSGDPVRRALLPDGREALSALRGTP